MNVLERIESDFKEAMKAKDEVWLSTLRLLRSALKNRQIELQHPLGEQEVFSVIKTMVKQYQDALRDFSHAGRQDLVERQEKEIDFLVAYLPPAMPQEELERIVTDAVRSAQVTDMGKAMGVAMRAVDGRADGSEVRRIVERLLMG